jgi:hypothetical protein
MIAKSNLPFAVKECNRDVSTVKLGSSGSGVVDDCGVQQK